LTDSSKLKHVA